MDASAAGSAVDAGSAKEDAGAAKEDAGAAKEDAGAASEDAGVAKEDAGVAKEDAEPPDGEKERTAKRSLSPGKDTTEEPSSKKAKDGSDSDDAPAVKRTGRGRGRPPGKSNSKEAPAVPSRFKAMAPLHLGLNLRLGAIYTADDLRQKCCDNKGKLASLEKFMKDPTKLAPVVPSAPSAPKAKPQAQSQVPASAPAPAPAVEGSLKRLRRENSTEGVRFLTGQIVWHVSAKGSRLAKVVSVAEKTGLSYSIRYFADGDQGDDTNSVEVAGADLKPFDVKEFVSSSQFQSTSSACESALATPSVFAPGDRSAGPFSLGQVVWHHSSKRPSWPARVQMVPIDDEDKYRVQLFSVRGASADGEVVAAAVSELLAFEKDDMPAFYQVAKEVQDAFMKETALAAAKPSLSSAGS